MRPTRLRARIGALLRIQLSDLLLDTPEPPDEVAHYLAQVDGGLEEARDALARLTAQAYQTERRLAVERTAQSEWDARTDEALRAGDEVRARGALQRQQVHAQEVETLTHDLARQQKQLAELKSGVDGLRAYAAELRARRERLLARASSEARGVVARGDDATRHAARATLLAELARATVAVETENQTT